MTTRPKTVLIVDDDEPVRHSLSIVLSSLGYRVRTVEDGLAALAEIRLEVPDAMLSDLYMPKMSGFELMSVVRRRFPTIGVIAMTGGHVEPDVLSGTAADAFHQKDGNLNSLLTKLERVLDAASSTGLHGRGRTPIWVQRTASDASGRMGITLCCPDCLRTFTQNLESSAGGIHHTDCVYCLTGIPYALVGNSITPDVGCARS